MSAREPGQHRRDLRNHLKPGALGKGYGDKPKASIWDSCPLLVFLLAAPPVMAVAAGWQLAAVLAGGAA